MKINYLTHAYITTLLIKNKSNLNYNYNINKNIVTHPEKILLHTLLIIITLTHIFY